MAGKPAALVLSPESPYPATGGGPLRTASLLEYLSRKYDIDLVVFEQPGSKPRHSGHVIPLRYHSKAPAARILRNLSRAIRGVPPLNDRFAGYPLPVNRRYPFALIEHFWCADYIDVLDCGEVWLDLHNLESALYRSSARGLTAPLMRRFASASLALERKLLPKFAGILVASPEDAERVQRIAPSRRIVVYPNTIPQTPLPRVAKQREIVFSGNLEYEPNREAVRYFRSAIWPLVKDPDVRWRLVGRNPQAVARLVKGDPRIELVGRVEDAIREIGRARVAVAPLRSGSGTRVKIVEAWAAGTPVVSTGLGAEGLPGRNGEHLLIADEPRAFAAAVTELLSSETLANRVSTAARAMYEQELTWDAAWKALSAAGL